MMTAFLLVFLLVLLPGCGGGGESPLPIKINLFTSEPPTLGRTVEVTAYFYLETDYQDVHDITVRIILPEGFEKTSGDLEWKGDILRGQNYFFGASAKVTKTGKWEIVARADSKSDGMVGYATLSFSVSDKTFTLPDNLLLPPWVDVSYYYDANQTIVVEAGEEFSIGLNAFVRGGNVWKQTHDEEMLTVVDTEVVVPEPYPLSGGNGTAWFLFKALRAGKTQITFVYYSAGDQFRDQKIFNIEIE
jgi:predicted secreted protein